ncbi:MAG: hypothetical protein V4773_28635 [Verrucomicrobiota bacterium]
MLPVQRFFHFVSLIAAFGAIRLDAQPASTAALGGHHYINQGLVGVGRIPASAKDKFGETIGSFSALSYDARSWRRNADGSYAGTFYMQPDRGYNNPGTTNWRARFFTLAIAFKPSAGATAMGMVLRGGGFAWVSRSRIRRL